MREEHNRRLVGLVEQNIFKIIKELDRLIIFKKVLIQSQLDFHIMPHKTTYLLNFLQVK